MGASKERNSTIELLRVILALLVVFTHLAPFFNPDPMLINNPSLLFFNNYILSIFRGFGKFGVNLFVIISGYYLICRNFFNIKKVLSLYSKVFIFSIIVCSTKLIFKIDQASPNYFLAMFTPIISRTWSFVTTYFILFIIHPLINKAFNKMNKTTYILWMVILSVYMIFARLSGNNLMLFIQIPLFVLLYLIGGFIKTYTPIKNIKPVFLLVTSIVLYFLICYLNTLSFVGDGVTNNSSSSIAHIFFGMNVNTSVMSVIIAATTFISFANMKPFHNKTINFLALGTFGVFLFQERLFTVLPIVKTSIANSINASYLLFVLLGIGITIYIVAMLLDYLYRLSIDKAINKY